MQAAHDEAPGPGIAAHQAPEPTVIVVPSRSTHPTPEQRLMAAVLEDAIRELQLRQRGASDAWATWRREPVRTAGDRETTAWFASGDRWWPYSFENICEALGLDAGTLRRRLGISAAG